jgi:hypothetical protein
MDNKVYTFSPDLVATIAQLIQLAILTGTDVYDHLLTLQTVNDSEGKLIVSPAYQEKLNAEVLRLTQQAEEMAKAGGYGLETN